MKRLSERAARETVAAAAPPHVTEQRAQADDVVLIDELAAILKTSTRTIQRQLRAGVFFIPEMVAIDQRHRWSRAVVAEHIAIAHEIRQSQRFPREVPRKPAGEAARESGRPVHGRGRARRDRDVAAVSGARR